MFLQHNSPFVVMMNHWNITLFSTTLMRKLYK